MMENKTNLPVKTIADIRALHPCYDPSRYAPEDWSGTALDVLKAEQVPAQDRIWVVCHEGWIDDRTLRLFAVWCARQELALTDDPDPRSVEVCDVAERYANGLATETELISARVITWAAAWDSARSAAWAAAWDAAWDAARSAARSAARPATQDAQIAHLIDMLEGKVNDGK